MRLFGFDIQFTGRREKALNAVYENRGWFRIMESFAGAWQRNVEIDNRAVQAHHADFACKTLIAGDISKLRVKYVEQDDDGIWSEFKVPSHLTVLHKPNNYQNRIQFWESWILSKLSRGNTYVLKERDNRNVVVALYVLDPNKVTPLVSDDNTEVFYQLSRDNMSRLEEDIIVPAREIIHDRFNCINHQLVGVPPVYAHGLSAQQGLNIQNNSIRLFKNGATPSGILTAPGAINETQISQLKDKWEANFGGNNAGRIAVLGDGMKFEKMALTAVEGQMIEQLKWTAEVVCSTYHMPPYKIIGGEPKYDNIQSLNVEYYSQCLQRLIEDAEECLDEGLGMGWRYGKGTEFDVDNLLRMDSVTQMEVLERARNVLTLDERRKKLDAKPIAGGATVYMQEQDHSIEAIAARDAMLIEQSKNPMVAAQPAAAAPAPPAEPDDDLEAVKVLAAWKLRSLLAAA